MPDDLRRIDDVAAYRASLEAAGERSPMKAGHLDRSHFFRYPQDTEALQNEISVIVNVDKKAKILEVGVGNLEEPLSYLAALYTHLSGTGKSLDESIDLTMVELRSRSDVGPTNKGYGKTYKDPGSQAKIGAAFLTPDQRGAYQAFPLEPPKDLKGAFQLSAASGEYEFHPDIVLFLEKQLADQSHAYFETPLENYLGSHQDRYDVVACNNVLQHLGGRGAYPTPLKDRFTPRSKMETFYGVVTSVLDRVGPGGLLIMHTDHKDTKGLATDVIFKDVALYKREFRKEGDGLYRRLTPEEVQERFEKKATVKGRKTSIRSKEAHITQKDRANIERIRARFRENKTIKNRLIDSGQLPHFEELTKRQQAVLSRSIDVSRLGRVPTINQLDEFNEKIKPPKFFERVREVWRSITGRAEIHPQDIKQLAQEYGVNLLYYPGSGFDTIARDALGKDHVIHLSAEENKDSTPGYFEIKRQDDQERGIEGFDMDVVGDFRDSPFQDHIFDAILVTGIYATDSITDDLVRVLKQGGYVFLAPDTMPDLPLLREKIAAKMTLVKKLRGIEVYQNRLDGKQE